MVSSTKAALEPSAYDLLHFLEELPVALLIGQP